LLTKARVRVDILRTKGKKSRELRAVDAAARAASLRGQGVDRGYQRGKIVRSMVKEGTATVFPAHGQTVVIRPYRKNVIRRAKGENKIRFNVWDESKQQYLGSCYAYSTPELSVQLHCHHLYRVQFNSQPRYPQILSLLEEVIH